MLLWCNKYNPNSMLNNNINQMFVMKWIVKILINLLNVVIKINNNFLKGYSFIKRKLLFYLYVQQDVCFNKIKNFNNVIKW
jgi:hypothetical protein